MYSVRDYGRMIADDIRMEAFCRALRQAIGPDSVVVDIGAGTGIFTLLACKYGARRVYAIEPSPVLQIAKESVKRNGFSDRVEFLQIKSEEVSLPQPADVIVSDLRGVLPLVGYHLPSIIDARDRFLAADGTLIPQRDVFQTALVELPKAYQKTVAAFKDSPFGFDGQTELKFALNNWYSETALPDQLLSAARACGEIDYRTVNSLDFSHRVTFTTSRAGTAHGLSAWFDAHLADDIMFSSGPGREDSVYGMAFFPFLRPLTLEEGDEVAIELEAKLVGNEYIWRWTTERAGQTLRQSSFLGYPLSPAALQKRAPSHVSEANDLGKAVHTALELMQGSRSNQEIAQTLVEQYPREFQETREALHLVGKLAEKYSD
jgi:protein arginine N-methyltransferase 1